MKKMICSLLVVFLCVVAFAQAANENVITIKVNCLENEEHGQGVFCNTFKQELEKLSGGKIKVNVFLNASLYTQDGALPAIISGDLEMNLTALRQSRESLPCRAASLSLTNPPPDWTMQAVSHLPVFCGISIKKGKPSSSSATMRN